MKRHPIKVTLNLAIAYITNSDKIGKNILISEHNCNYSNTHSRFLKTREDNNTKGTVLARHLIQSFLPGEISYEKAHEIGLELCRKVLKDEYEFILATHVDRGHIHNHIIFNNVNIVTGNAISLIKRATTNQISKRQAMQRKQLISD